MLAWHNIQKNQNCLRAPRYAAQTGAMLSAAIEPEGGKLSCLHLELPANHHIALFEQVSELDKAIVNIWCEISQVSGTIQGCIPQLSTVHLFAHNAYIFGQISVSASQALMPLY